MSFSNPNSLEDHAEISDSLKQKLTMSDSIVALGPKRNDFVCENDVNDHLMCKSRDVDLDNVCMNLMLESKLVLRLVYQIGVSLIICMS